MTFQKGQKIIYKEEGELFYGIVERDNGHGSIAIKVTKIIKNDRHYAIGEGMMGIFGHKESISLIPEIIPEQEYLTKNGNKITATVKKV